MPKRLTAALASLLMLASVLAVVPLASPAAAHPQTTTKQYCAYDPFAGNQCWTETVSVAHHHAPANQPCPAGTTGTPPNCLPIPSDNSNHDPNAGDSTDDDSSGDDSSGDDSSGDDGTGSDSTDDPDTTDPQDGGSDQTQNPCEPWPTCNQSSDPKPTTTTSTDPCGDYAENLVNALSKAGHTGTYNPPTNPGGCDGPSSTDVLNALKGYTETEARRLLSVLEALQNAPDTVSEEGAKAIATLADKIKTEWDEAPPAVKAGVSAVVAIGGCIGLVSLVVKSSTATAGTALAAWGAYFRTPAGQAAVERTCNVAVPVLAAIVQTQFLNGGDDSPSNNGNQDDGHPGGTDAEDVDPPSSQEDVDNTRDPHEPDLPHARRMCAAYPDNDFFCGQVADNEQDDGE